MVTLEIGDISWSDPGKRRQEKDTLLQRDLIVHSLRRVYSKDPDWILALLRRHAGTLRELQLVGLNRKLLHQVAQLPGLRKLEVWWVDKDLLGGGPPLPEHWDCQLRWLKLNTVPQKLCQNLLSTHRHSLEVLEIYAGTGPKTGCKESWPRFVNNLPPLFDCGLHRLRYLSLDRHRPGCDPRCYAQLCAVRAVLPGCTVKCTHCMEQYI